MKKNSKKESKYKMTISKFFKHLHTVNKHRFKVFILCCKAGQPWRGLLHDLSKYSPTEFFEGVKYYQGTYSPIKNRKMEAGYSEAWLHHFGRNKHHYEYWYDSDTYDKTPVIPYPYVVEMICDQLAAGMIYQGKKWTKEFQLEYWLNKRETALINPKIDLVLTKVFTDVSKHGVDKVLDKENLRKIYDRYTR